MSVEKSKPPYFYKIQNYNIYRENREMNIWKHALEEHYKRNPEHHPEHFADPYEMSDLNKKHMLCDLLGTYLGNNWFKNADSKMDVSHAATYCSREPSWKLVEKYYPGIYEGNVELYSRWSKGHFEEEKPNFIKWMKCLLSEKVTPEEFALGLFTFRCAQVYMLDLQWHQYATEYVGKTLFPDDAELLNLLEGHDKDKWDGFMIASHVLKFLLDVETIELDRKFKNMCLDEFIYNTLEKGKSIRDQLKKLRKS